MEVSSAYFSTLLSVLHCLMWLLFFAQKYWSLDFVVQRLVRQVQSASPKGTDSPLTADRSESRLCRDKLRSEVA
jgi:hypothetical protein